MTHPTRTIAVRYFLQTLAICFSLAIGFGLLYAYLHSATDSQFLRLGFGFLSVGTIGACLSLHAHFVLIRPLHKLSRGLKSLDSQALISEDFVILSSSQLAGEFDEIEREFHALIAKLHHRHREVLLTKNNLSQATSRFHENKLNALGEMAAGIAHEINNPLAILVGRLEQFREIMALPNAQTKIEAVVASMEKTVFRIQEAVADLELLASNPSSEEIRKVNLSRLLKRLSKVVRNRFQKDEIVFETTLAVEIEIEAREVELSQALLSLLENAAEAAQKADERFVRVQIRIKDESGDEAVISIEDSGTGIEKSLRQNLFQPYFTTKSEGRGMGLSLAKSVIESHSGSLSFDFEHTQTLVRISLPLQQRKKSVAQN